MNIEIRKARFEKKHAELAAEIKVLRDRIAWWVGDKAENQKLIDKAKARGRKLDKDNPDLAALALEARRSRGFPG